MNKRHTIPFIILFVGRTKFTVKQISHSPQGSKLIKTLLRTTLKTWFACYVIVG